MVSKSRRYWEAYAALHDKQCHLPIDEVGVDEKSSLRPNMEGLTVAVTAVRGDKGQVRSKGGSVRPPLEDYEQIVAATWLDKEGVPFFHVPNGGFRRYEEAQKLKRMGVKPGVPDFVIPVARGGYHGLYIELKRIDGGRVSDAQRFWGDLLTKEGYLWRVAKGAGELKVIVMGYMGHDK